MNELALTVLAVLCLWVITDRHVHTGVGITAGLGLILVACLAMLDTGWVTRAFVVMTYGCILVVAGLLWRRYISPRFARHHLKE